MCYACYLSARDCMFFGMTFSEGKFIFKEKILLVQRWVWSVIHYSLQHSRETWQHQCWMVIWQKLFNCSFEYRSSFNKFHLLLEKFRFNWVIKNMHKRNFNVFINSFDFIYIYFIKTKGFCFILGNQVFF